VRNPNTLPLLVGGPVEPQRGWILTAEAPEGVEHRELGSGLYLSASPVLLRRALITRPLPKRTHVLAGYAGWGAGQLDDELEKSAWLIMPVELDLIFDVPAAAIWETAIRRLGADPHLLQMGHGVH
jgi:putative transcriptional regulator